jgi:hypothetical protein
MDHVRSMSATRRSMPVLGVWMPDLTVVLIDGGHRYMARVINGEAEITYNLIAEEDWKPYAAISGKWPPT